MLKAFLFQNPLILLGLFFGAMFNINSNPRLFAELIFAMFGYFFVMLASTNTFFVNVGVLAVMWVLLLGIIG